MWKIDYTGPKQHPRPEGAAPDTYVAQRDGEFIHVWAPCGCYMQTNGDIVVLTGCEVAECGFSWAQANQAVQDLTISEELVKLS